MILIKVLFWTILVMVVAAILIYYVLQWIGWKSTTHAIMTFDEFHDAYKECDSNWSLWSDALSYTGPGADGLSFCNIRIDFNFVDFLKYKIFCAKLLHEKDRNQKESATKKLREALYGNEKGE